MIDSGTIIRGTENPNKSKVVSISHIDIKGNGSIIPTFSMKKMLIGAAVSSMNILNNHFENRN